MIQIKAIAENPDQYTAPVLGYFPSGYDPLKNTDSESNSVVKVYKDASRNPKKPRMELVVQASCGTNVNLVGTSHSKEETVQQLCNYALGVLDKETGVLTMVPVAANRVFRLGPKVEGSEVPDNEPVDEENAEAAVKQKANKLKTVTAMYSTKKDIRRDEKRSTLHLAGGPGTEEDMNHQLKEVKINKKALEDVKSDSSRDRPPYNLDAVSPDMAYPLDKIILKGDWDYLSDVYEHVQSGSQLDPSVYPRFVCNRVGKLVNMKDESQKKITAAVLSYITHLIKYKDKHSMDGFSAAKHHQFPTILEHRFAPIFGVENRRLTNLQLLISYVLVLTLFADDFLSDTSDIAKDLRMDRGALKPHYEYLGCKFVRHENSVVATLPLPLEFKTFRRKRVTRK